MVHYQYNAPENSHYSSFSFSGGIAENRHVQVWCACAIKNEVFLSIIFSIVSFISMIIEVRINVSFSCLSIQSLL